VVDHVSNSKVLFDYVGIINEQFVYGVTSYEKPREPGYSFSPYFDSDIEKLYKEAKNTVKQF
jgi:hypothetical protein